jgi:hypothetical protein
MTRMLLGLIGFAAVLVQAPAVAADAWDTVKSYTVEKKDEAVSYGRKLVRETDRGIHDLERDAAKASGEIKAQRDRDIKELKAKRAQAAKKLDEMGKATASAWDSAKDGFADAYKDLHQAYDKAAKKLK